MPMEEESSHNSIGEQRHHHHQQQQLQQQYKHHHHHHHHHQLEENDRNRHRRQEEEVRDNFAFIKLRAENSRRFRNFALLGREATFAIPPPEGTDIVPWIESALREIRTYALHSCKPNDYVGLSFDYRRI